MLRFKLVNKVNQALPKVVFEKIKNKEGKVVDVRTPEEIATVCLADSINIELGDRFLQEALEILDPNENYFILCAAGIRSNKAAALLKKHGVTNVTNIAGGIDKWLKEELPLNID